jgi:hypothetical protein
MELNNEQRISLNEIVSNGRMIFTEDGANRLLKPFGLTADELNIVYETGDDEIGINWGAGSERWGKGRQVNISTLAWVLADRLGAPDIKYDTNYSGEGRRSAAVTEKAVIQLRLLAGDQIDPCADCGGYDHIGGYGPTGYEPTVLCNGCATNRRNHETVTMITDRVIRQGTNLNGKVLTEDKHDLELMMGRQRWMPDHLVNEDKRGDSDWRREIKWDWDSLEEALEWAYIVNARNGLSGPVLVKRINW